MCPTTHTLFQCKPREVISHFNTLLPLVVTAKSVNVYGLWKRFCLPQHKFPTVIQLTTNKYIILIIWFYIFFFQGILWCFSYPVESIWEDLISLTTFICRHKLTWQVDVQRFKKLHATVWQKLTTVAEGKVKIEMSPFSWLNKFPLMHI